MGARTQAQPGHGLDDELFDLHLRGARGQAQPGAKEHRLGNRELGVHDVVLGYIAQQAVELVVVGVEVGLVEEDPASLPGPQASQGV